MVVVLVLLVQQVVMLLEVKQTELVMVPAESLVVMISLY